MQQALAAINFDFSAHAAHVNRSPWPCAKGKGARGRWALKAVTLRGQAFQGLYLRGGTPPPRESLNTMTHTLTRLIPAALLGVLVAGCATVPGDPYYYESPRYGVYEQPGYIYNNAPPAFYPSAPVYRAPPVVYSAPPPVIYLQGRDRDHNRWDNRRDNNGWRERDRDRAERDRAQNDREARDRAHRDQQARDADRRARDQNNARQDQARREQAERDRRAADDRRERENRPPRAAPDDNRGAPPGWRRNQSPNSFDKP